MAKRDILKEAIADAKTVKETAIANAKAALEEAFTPRLKEMLATKLEEMDLEEDAEALEEMTAKEKKEGDNRKDTNPEEKRELKMKEKIKKGSLEEEELDEEINLDEILAEIEEMEENKDEIKEDEATRKEEEGYIDGEEDADEDKDEEELDLDDMSDDDLKDFIEDVIADMVASGELEAGENFEEEGEEEEVDVDVEDDVDVEISEAKKKDKEDDKDKMEEAVGNPISTSVKSGSKNKYDEDFMKAVKDDLANLMKKVGLKEEDEIDEAASGTPTSTSYSKGNKYDEDFMKAVKDDLAKLMSKVGLKEEELDEAYNTIESLKSDLNEVNLLNAKLLYTNKIFKAKTLTESQKVKVLGAFDKAGTVKETKLVYETLNEGLKTKKSPIKESLGAASRVSRSVNAKKPIIETDPMVERFKKLAGIK